MELAEQKEATVLKVCGFLAFTVNANFNFFASEQQITVNSVSYGCVRYMGLYCVALHMGDVGYCFICTSQPPEMQVPEPAAVNAYKCK